MRILGRDVSVFTPALCALTLLLAPAAPAGAQLPLSPAELEQLREQARGQEVGVSSEEPAAAAGSAAWTDGSAQGPLLERPISRTDYQLGPGDRLTLSIFGYKNQVFPVAVTPEGTVIVPTVGVVPVRGLNLEQAAQRTRRQVLRFFPGAEVELSLAAVRSFKVFVVGNVDSPGLRQATAVTRVSEVVPAVSEGGVIYRNVMLRRAGDTLRVDLVKFLQSGDLEHNPFLREGDVVQVPTIDKTVTITGEIPFPGTYEFRSPETLADLIRLGNGGGAFQTKAADTLLLMRFTNDPRGEIITIPRVEAVGPLGRNMRLEPFDALFVPRRSQYMERTTSTVEGEVEKPGIYPIRPGVTTVGDLIEMAGGFTSDAATIEAVLRRAPTGLSGDGASSRSLTAIPPELLTRGEQRILQVTSRADENSVLIDVRRDSPAYDLPLQDGDRLFLPKRRNDVVVLGAVARPGLVVYTEGQSIEHFVERAGGYMRRADTDDIVVLRTSSGTPLQRKDLQSIEPGDRIVVPFRERTTFVERVQTTQGIISTVSGVVLTIVGLERLWDSITN